MLPALRSVFGRLNLTLLGLTIVGASFWFTDQITNRQPEAPHVDPDAVLAERRAHPSDARVFYYIIDSLRYETALDPAIMPNLVALCAEGARGRMMPGFNSSSAASLRDAFTGRENAAVLASVATFVHSDAGVESIFHEMALRGFTTAAYSAGFFHQFGSGIMREVEIGHQSSRDVQEAHVLSAVEALRSGDFNCVIGHLLYTDAIAHEDGVGTPGYVAAFQRADALIPIIRSKLPPGVTFVITGDHGHDLKGRHGIGLNVPTLGLYVGSRFAPGVDFGTTTVMTHRYLLSQALGLPPTTEAYSGDAVPRALVSPPLNSHEWAPRRTGGSADAAWPVWIYVSLYAALWWNLLCRDISPLRTSGWREFALWAGILPLFLHDTMQLAAGAIVAGLLLMAFGWKASLRSLALWIGLPTAAGLFCHEWGRIIAVIDPWMERLPLAALGCYWGAIGLVGVVFATRANRSWLMAGVFAVPALFFHPVYHHYGFPGTLAPLMACWFVFYVRSLVRAGELAPKESRIKLSLAAAGLFLMLQPLAGAETNFGAFGSWRSLVPGWDVANLKYFVIPALLAKGVLYFPRRPGWSSVVIGVVLIGFVQLLESLVWIPDFYTRRAFALGLLAAWGVALWQKRPEGRLFGITFLFIVYFSFVALTPRNFMETAVMIGALGICAQTVAWFPQRENLRVDYLFLALFGIVIAGWASMRWSGTHLEWHAIYEWASAATVEHYVAWFVPWIAVKGLVPWIIILWMLHSRLSGLQALPAREVMIVFCSKVVLLLMVATGLGGADTYNRSYLQTASVVGVFVMLYLGVVFLSRAWPGPLTPQATSNLKPISQAATP